MSEPEAKKPRTGGEAGSSSASAAGSSSAGAAGSSDVSDDKALDVFSNFCRYFIRTLRKPGHPGAGMVQVTRKYEPFDNHEGLFARLLDFWSTVKPIQKGVSGEDQIRSGRCLLFAQNSGGAEGGGAEGGGAEVSKRGRVSKRLPAIVLNWELYCHDSEHEYVVVFCWVNGSQDIRMLTANVTYCVEDRSPQEIRLKIDQIHSKHWWEAVVRPSVKGLLVGGVLLGVTLARYLNRRRRNPINAIEMKIVDAATYDKTKPEWMNDETFSPLYEMAGYGSFYVKALCDGGMRPSDGPEKWTYVEKENCILNQLQRSRAIKSYRVENIDMDICWYRDFRHLVKARTEHEETLFMTELKNCIASLQTSSREEEQIARIENIVKMGYGMVSKDYSDVRKLGEGTLLRNFIEGYYHRKPVIDMQRRPIGNDRTDDPENIIVVMDLDDEPELFAPREITSIAQWLSNVKLRY